jgi:5'/3'-nucleotidase SurE
MRILITNDDGVNALGLQILANVAKKFGSVICVAPIEEQSGKSHSIIIKEPFIVKKYEDIVKPIVDKIIANQKEVENLTMQRDELLPLLMNGQVSVNYHLSDD